MSDIPNTEYITVNKDGIFVGGKPATTYQGEEILLLNGVRKNFADIQRLNENVAELHVLSSETFGEYAKVGNPSGNHGRNAWCRAKFNDGRVTSWVFYYTFGSAANCAYYCAYHCATNVRDNASFRSGVFGLANDKQNTKTAIQPEKKSQNPEWHESDFHSTSAVYPTYVYNVYPYRTMGGLFGNKPVTYYNVRVRFNSESKGMKPPRASDCAEIYVDNSPYQSYWEAVYEFHDGLLKTAQQKANDFHTEIVNQIHSNKR